MNNKVFIVIDNLGGGGAQRQVVEFLKFSDKKKFDISVINLTENYNSLKEEIEEIGIRVISFQHSGFFNPKTLFELVRLFKNEKPHIIYTYLFTSDTYGRLAAKIASIPVIICATRSVDQWKKWHHIFVDRILANFTDTITINAENIRLYLVNVEKLDSKKITTIYNGIDLKRFERATEKSEEEKQKLGIKSDALVVGMVGHFSPRKDYKTFFEAAEIIAKEMSNVCFVAVGAGQEKQVLESRVSEMDELKNKVIFTGHRKDTDQLINIFDIGVLSSHYEGCPNVILEYMACSKPVVASNVGGCKELVVEGETGYIVSPRNSQVLAEKLLVLLKDEQLRQRMGALGRKRVVENFTSDVMAKKTEDLFLELLRKKMKKG